MKTTNKKWLAKAMARNGHDRYAVVNLDGSVEVGPAACYSSILQCGHDPADYGIKHIIQCGYGNIADAMEYLNNL